MCFIFYLDLFAENYRDGRKRLFFFSNVSSYVALGRLLLSNLFLFDIFIVSIKEICSYSSSFTNTDNFFKQIGLSNKSTA